MFRLGCDEAYFVGEQEPQVASCKACMTEFRATVNFSVLFLRVKSYIYKKRVKFYMMQMCQKIKSFLDLKPILKHSFMKGLFFLY